MASRGVLSEYSDNTFDHAVSYPLEPFPAVLDLFPELEVVPPVTRALWYVDALCEVTKTFQKEIVFALRCPPRSMETSASPRIWFGPPRDDARLVISFSISLL